MSKNPERAKCYRAPHKQGAGADAPSYAEPSARSIAERSDAGIKKKMRSEDTASSKTEHRFDKFARRIAAGMLSAIRTSLSVFSSPDRDRWPAERLLEYLKGAEELARDMLREIAAKLTLTPQPLRERSNVSTSAPETIHAPQPCFRLGVNAETAGADEKTGVPLSRFAGEGSGVRAQFVHPGARPLDPPPAAGRGKRVDDESALSRRLAALEDVLAHPGKHAARMARALYRAEHGKGQRLIAQSPDDVLIDRADAADTAFRAGDGDALAKLHMQLLDPG